MQDPDPAVSLRMVSIDVNHNMGNVTCVSLFPPAVFQPVCAFCKAVFLLWVNL